jgi:hypothetical protein
LHFDETIDLLTGLTDFTLRDNKLLKIEDRTHYMMLINLPFTFKLFYGLIADNCALFGSRKKAYIVGGGLIQFICLQLLFWFMYENHKGDANPIAIVALVAAVNLCNGFMDIVVDMIKIDQARKEPIGGAETLSTLEMISSTLGGTLGSLLASHMY